VSALVHLQAAACARPTSGTVAAQVAHLHREVEMGAYEAEAAVATTLDRLRAALGDLVGLPGEGVVLTDSASSGLALLLATWPLPAVPVVAVAPSEWGPNLDAFARRGAQMAPLRTDGHGRIDLDALRTTLEDGGVDVVHVVHAASHRGLVQPVAEVVALGRAAGVPVWVDAAQALGHHETAYAADAVYAPGRKWLRGPRGTGVLALAPPHAAVLEQVRLREPGDGSVAARVGWAHAVDELVAAGPALLRARLHDAGARLRAAVGEVPGWECVDAPDAEGAILGLRPAAGQDVEATQVRLLAEHRVLATACLPWRAPGDMVEPLLRLAPHADLTDADVARVVAALGG